MARATALLTTLFPTRLLTWLVIAVVAMPFVSVGAAADFEDRGASSMQMPMECDHGTASEMASHQSGNLMEQDQEPCCPDCEMPDCATNSGASVLSILGNTAQALPFQVQVSHTIGGDHSQFAAELSTPRKPPRV